MNYAFGLESHIPDSKISFQNILLANSNALTVSNQKGSKIIEAIHPFYLVRVPLQIQVLLRILK